jgi:transposase
MENLKKKADVFREFVLVNYAVQKIFKNRAKIISAFEENGSTIKRLRNPERSDAIKALLKRCKPQRSDNVPVSGPLFIISFVLSNF